MEQGLTNLLVFWKAVRREFRENLGAVHKHFKPPIVEWLQLQAGNFLFEFFQDFLRQTDGSGFVLSSRAILDLDFHGAMPPLHQRGGSVG